MDSGQLGQQDNPNRFEASRQAGSFETPKQPLNRESLEKILDNPETTQGQAVEARKQLDQINGAELNSPKPVETAKVIKPAQTADDSGDALFQEFEVDGKPIRNPDGSISDDNIDRLNFFLTGIQEKKD